MTLRIALNFESDRAHEADGVAVGDYAGLHFVVEGHDAIDQLVFEMNVGAETVEHFGDLSEGKIVGAGKADGASIEEATQDGLGTNAAVVGVRTAKDFVHQKQDWGAGGCFLHDVAEAENFGVEA